MLCPGCVQHGIPQMQRVHAEFDRDDVEVVGLHTVFEHHDVMGPAALEVFIHENRLAFPIAVDQPDGEGGAPRTMRKYGMRGTPTLILIDRQGALRFQQLGQVDDLALGALIGQLLAETPR
jgi:peroxiredoxin